MHQFPVALPLYEAAGWPLHFTEPPVSGGTTVSGNPIAMPDLELRLNYDVAGCPELSIPKSTRTQERPFGAVLFGRPWYAGPPVFDP